MNCYFDDAENIGAGEGTRTPTSWTLDPKSSASANSATPANIECYFASAKKQW